MIDLTVVGQLVDERNATYSTRDTMLYALSLGFGATPTDPGQLRYVYEERLESLPTLPMVIGYPGFFMPHPDRHIGWEQLLHAEEHVVVHRPLPPAGVVHDQTYVDGVVDRGANRGAFVYTRKELHDENNAPLATVYSTLLCRADGGCGSAGSDRRDMVAVPDRPPDVTDTIATLPQQALLYRLCGDTNPIHADPGAAGRAGFERPLLHGRCTFGHAMHVLIRQCCEYDGQRIRSLRARFAAPFFPGETLRVSIWKASGQLHFSAESAASGVTVLSHGLAELRN
jgi:acyl dehydratase